MALYRQLIKFKNDVSEDGTLDPNYSDFFTDIPASIVPKGGGEIYRGVQLQAQTTNVIECRYIDGLLPNMIIEDQNKVSYSINRMLDSNGRQREWMIEAIQVVV